MTSEAAVMTKAEKEKARLDKRRKFLLEGNLLNVIFVTAFPQVVTMIVDSLFNMGDTFFVSRIGEAAISAVSINDSLLMIIRAISIGFAMGSASFISRALGANKDEEASKVATTTLYIAVGTLTVLAFAASFFLEPLVNFLGATDSIRQYALDYAKWILPSAPITAATVCLAQMLRAEGNATAAMIGILVGNIIDFGLNPLFIFTFGWGVSGAASSTTLAKFISLIFLLWPYLNRKCIISLKPSNFSPTKELFGELARMGFPTMLRTSMMSVAMIITNNIAASFGDVVLAASAVASKSLRLIGSALMGFGQGFQPVAGFCWGAKKYDRVRKAFWNTLAIGAVAGTLLSTFLIIFAKPLIMIFSKDPDVLALGLILVISQSIVMLPHAWGMVCVGLFQAIGNAAKAGILGLSRQLLSLIPCLLILSYLFGVNGFVYAQATSDAISFTLAVIFVIPTLKQLNIMAKQTPADLEVDFELDESAFEVSFDDD